MTLERGETEWVLHLEGECSMASAAALRVALGEGLSAEVELVLDFEAVVEIDVAVLQVLWSAWREAQGRNRQFHSRVREALEQVARDAGFESFPGAALPTAPAETGSTAIAEG